VQHTAETTKQAIDAVSVFTVVGTLSDLLPPMAALVTIIWTGIRIYETETVQGFLGRDQDKDDDR
jgi:hypothetical protein